MRLTEHFSLEEFTFSQTAARLGINNEPPKQVLENIRIVADRMEVVREKLGGLPIFISSGFRSPRLNSAIGGAPTSAHLTGWAVDFVCPALGTPYEVCRRISDSGISYDQLIHEFGRWVHISFAPALRRQNLTILSSREGYSRGIHRA